LPARARRHFKAAWPPKPDKKLIWTYFEAMLPEHMPKSLLVMGSGAIGIEFASFYRNYASRGARQHCDALGEGELARRDQPTWRAFSMLVPTPPTLPGFPARAELYLGLL
jgi:hypothetical protein